MADFTLARNLGTNLGTMFENASKTFHRGIDTSTVALPPSVAAFINTNYYNVQTTFTSEEITKALNSTNEKEVYTVLKYLVALSLTKDTPQDVVPFFPFVVKNVSSNNYKVRRLVYALLLQYHQLEPDIALLSINAIQRSLVDKNPVNRALAIRCLSGIRIPAILPILLLSLEKCIKDSSALVRAASATAISNCVELDGANAINLYDHIKEALQSDSSAVSQLYAYLDVLLSDSDPKVLSTAFLVFHTTFNGFLDVFHNKIGHLVDHFAGLDPFAQSSFLDLMTDYAKAYFGPFGKEDVPPVLARLRDQLENVRFSPDAQVVLSSIRFVTNVVPFADFPMGELALKFATLGNEPTRVVFWSEIEYLLRRGLVPAGELPVRRFFPLMGESMQEFRTKVGIMFRLTTEHNFSEIFVQARFVVETCEVERQLVILRGLNGVIGSLQREQLDAIVAFYMGRLGCGDNEAVVGEYVTGLRQLVQGDLEGNVGILVKLVGKLMNGEMGGSARGAVIWLLGEFALAGKNESREARALAGYAPKVAAELVAQFKNESDWQVKVQTLTCVAKVLMRAQGQQGKIMDLFQYALALARADSSLEVRDQSRFLQGLLPETEKGVSIEVGMLMYEGERRATVATDVVAEGGLAKFNMVTECRMDEGYGEYYEDLRGSGFEVKQYGQRTGTGHGSGLFQGSSLGSGLGNVSSGRHNGQGSRNHSRTSSADHGVILPKRTPSANYKLQSLDDFLAS